MIRVERNRNVSGGPKMPDGISGSIAWTDGPHDLLDALQTGAFHADGYSKSWYGNETALDVFRKGSEGTEEYVPSVNALMEQIDANYGTETKGYEIADDVTGFAPNVPNAIQNIPEAMTQFVDLQSDHAPITVWVNTTMSGGFDKQAIARRGAGVAALVLKLQALRPVMLNVCVALDRNNWVVCPIHARPLSIAQISYILCSAGWTRYAYSYLKTLGASGGWDRIFTAHGNAAASKEFQLDSLRWLGGDLEHDIYIPQLFLYDELASNPVAWVREKLSHYMKGN